jgi:hypothetical protein
MTAFGFLSPKTNMTSIGPIPPFELSQIPIYFKIFSILVPDKWLLLYFLHIKRTTTLDGLVGHV